MVRLLIVRVLAALSSRCYACFVDCESTRCCFLPLLCFVCSLSEYSLLPPPAAMLRLFIVRVLAAASSRCYASFVHCRSLLAAASSRCYASFVRCHSSYSLLSPPAAMLRLFIVRVLAAASSCCYASFVHCHRYSLLPPHAPPFSLSLLQSAMRPD
jgi:hypothetical protein